jgi:hypothetical protein
MGRFTSDLIVVSFSAVIDRSTLDNEPLSNKNNLWLRFKAVGFWENAAQNEIFWFLDVFGGIAMARSAM